MRPDEVGRFFAHKPDPNGLPYAGQTLVLISGEQPISIRRTLYFRHPRFEGLFDPHRDFGIVSAYRSPPPSKAVIPLPSDPPESFTVEEPIPIEPTKPWARLEEWVQEVIQTLRKWLFNWWALFLFWLPLGFVTPIFFLFWAVGMTSEFFVMLLVGLIGLFPFLLGA